MSYLIDTNILVWWFANPNRLPKEIDQLLSERPHLIAVSVVSPWEIAIKRAKGKLTIRGNYNETLRRLEFRCLEVKLSHIEALDRLPPIHADPFDRMLVAQALAEDLVLITADAALASCPIATKLVAL